MKKVIAIVLITLSLSSCGIRLGDYHRWQEIHGNDSLDENNNEFASLDCENCDKID